MSEQNKTENVAILDDQNQQPSTQNLNLDKKTQQSDQQNHLQDQSLVQIILPERRSNLGLEEQIKPLNLIDSYQGINQTKALQIKLKQSERKLNPHDVSAVCIDLLSDNETFERKCTLNSLHYSRVFNEMRKEEEAKKEEKIFMQQGIQTNEQVSLIQRNQEHIRIEDKYTQIDKQQSIAQQEELQKGTKTQQNKTINEVQCIQVQTEQQVILVEQPQQQGVKIQITTEYHVEQANIQLKQTLVGKFQEHQNEQTSIKQTAYINFLENTLPEPELRPRKITFQAIQIHEQDQLKQQFQSQIQIQNESFEGEDLKIFLEAVSQTEYDRIIMQLSEKVTFLESQVNRLVEDKQESDQKFDPKTIEPTISVQNVQENSIKHLSIYNAYTLAIQSPQKQQQIPKEFPSQQEQYQSSKPVEVSQRKLHYMRQFSSGQVSNLLVESETQLIDLRELQAQKLSPTNQNNIEQMPVVFSSSSKRQNSLQPTQPQIQLPVLVTSQSNLAIIKESYEQLPYDRLKNIITLDHLVSKISFKEKHFPSSCSTEKQLKLYGKRLLRVLMDQSLQDKNYNQQQNMLNIQNDMEYYKSQQQVIYYLKSCQTFAFICYFNHTIYIGEYITQGPLKQIIRQGYGIQIRDSKYIYQGEFFADKKHGCGFIEFTGKNPFIYCGCFLDGFMDGHGKSMNENGETYLGDYKLGQRDGCGKLVYNKEKGVYYEGEFYDGFKHGRGFEVFENGDSYKGFYVRDKFQGEGQYHWKNQTLYQGTFVEGYKHGPGLLKFTNGKTFEKYYYQNKQINLEDDKKTIKSSRISTFSQSKLQEKTLIQQKPRNLKNMRSLSGKSLSSYKSTSNQKSGKLIKDKLKIAQLLKEKEIQQDLKNLDKILKDPTDESKIKKIFSVKKIDTRDKIVGKMYNTTERPSMKISEKGELDLFQLSKIGSQRKSLVNFDSEERLEELRDSTHHRRVQRTTNFSQF